MTQSEAASADVAAQADARTGRSARLVLAAVLPVEGGALALGGVTLFGLGQGLLIPPIIGVVLSRVPATDSGAAAGLLVTTQQMSGTIGLVLVSLGFFIPAGGGRASGYVSGFQVACVCDPGAGARLAGLHPAAHPRPKAAVPPG